MRVRAIALDLDGTLYDHDAAQRAIGDVGRADYEDALLAQIGPAPRLARLLDRLRSRYQLTLISNGSSQRQRRKLQRLGIDGCFDAIVISGELGIHKPHRGVFLHAASLLGVAPEELLVVGDDPHRDILPAKRLGMPAWWVSRGEPWRLGIAPDRIVGDVEALWELVDADAGEEAAC